jgi:hydroxymethylglutaryl-CoA lyase
VNASGAERAIAAGADGLCIAIAVSESFSQRNVRKSVAEAIDEARKIVEMAAQSQSPCSAGVSSVFGCVFEGQIRHDAVVQLANALVDVGIAEIMLADTTGMAAPSDVASLVPKVVRAIGSDIPVGLHFHNTRGLGLTNVLAGLGVGIRNFDTSLGGLGGCPFAPGATGNVATEEVVHLFQLEGYEHGIDLDGLIAAAAAIESALGATLPSQVLRAGARWRGHEAW